MTSSGIDYADFFAIVGLYNGMYNPIKIRIVCFHVAQDLFRDCLHLAPPKLVAAKFYLLDIQNIGEAHT